MPLSGIKPWTWFRKNCGLSCLILLFQTIDFFRQELEHIENEQPLTENIDTLLQKVNRLIDQIHSGGQQPEQLPPPQPPLLPQTLRRPPSSPGPDSPMCLQVFFDEGCGMENLRAFMLVSSVKDLCAEGDFTYEPQGVDSDPATADQIVESGFLLFFRNQADRDAAIHAVTASGSVRSYQAVDQPAPQSEPQPAAEPAPSPRPPTSRSGGGAKLRPPQSAPAQAPAASAPKKALLRSAEGRTTTRRASSAST